MNLRLELPIGCSYHSNSQLARVITESWVEREMYCPSCDSDILKRLPHGTKVFDFQCDNCEERFQVKSSSRPVGNRIVDSEYNTMIEAVYENRSPSFMFLHYSCATWEVRDLLLIPRHLISPSAIERRNPLREKARRAGWVGCNIVLANIPQTGRIYAIKDSTIFSPEAIREKWNSLRFVEKIEPKQRGWLVDVLRCILSLGQKEFTLQQIYAQFEDELSRLHPENKHVRPKIRQQLQVLRDRGRIRFIGSGRYKILED